MGPGGTGKTSLATECARDAAAAFSDGVWFVGLDFITDPELVASAVVGALDLRDMTGRPARERLRENVANRSLLLVLDNFEHLLAAAGLVAELLSVAPLIRFLVTSRAPLHLAAEHIYPVGPLPLPAPSAMLEGSGLDELLAVPSARLFVDRAQTGPAVVHAHERERGRHRRDLRPLGWPAACDRAGGSAVAAACSKRQPASTGSAPRTPCGAGGGCAGAPRTLHETIAADWRWDACSVPSGPGSFVHLT